MFNAKTGGRPPVPRDVSEGLRTWQPFAQRRDLPDVLGLADLTATPRTTYELVRQRLDGDYLFVDRTFFPLPKSQGHGTRPITVLNPLDELALRVYVGRVSAAVRRSIDESSVLNGLLRNPGPGWFSADFKEQSQRRRDRQRTLYDSPSTSAVGFVDVKDFFPSCDHEALRGLLQRSGAATGAVDVLMTLLGRLFPSHHGLPIGFEGSGPLANMLLSPVDRLLDQRRIPFVRWTDDIDMFLGPRASWPDLLTRIEEELGTVGLAINHEKTTCLSKGTNAEDRLLDPGRDSIFDEDALVNIEGELDWDALVGSWTGEGTYLSPGRYRSMIGFLRSERDARGVRYLTDVPQWIDWEPSATGAYLSALLEDPKLRRSIDLDWLVDLAVGRDPTQHTAAGQLHLLRALSKAHVGKEHAKQIHDFSFRKDVLTEFAPLGSWATMAWSYSEGWRAPAAMDTLGAVEHYSYKRAALAGFAHHRPGHAIETRLRALARRSPDLAPVIQAVLISPSGSSP